MPHALINGARLWYDLPGRAPADAPVLLLHHGYTACRVNWQPVAERLQDTYRVILMECRGAGDSEDTNDGYSLEQYARDVIGMADYLQLETFTYAGHSMGGGVGFVLGLEHAQRLAGLILMAPIPSGGTKRPSEAVVSERRRARREGDRAFFLAEQRLGKFRDDVQTDAWFEHRVDNILRATDGHYFGMRESMCSLDVKDRIGEITVPTLMIAGGVDELLKSNLRDYMRLPNASLHVCSRAGHEVAVHEPDEVSRAIAAFMEHGAISAANLGQVR